MKWFSWCLQFVLTLVMLFMTPLLVALALPFAKSDNKTNIFPSWLQWINTYDDTGCDQGLYEPQVAAKMKYGWYVKTWYWLGIRNQCYTLFWALSPEPKDRIHSETAGWKIIKTSEGYFCYLSKRCDVGVGWKLFNADGRTTFYLRPRFWKPPSN